MAEVQLICKETVISIKPVQPGKFSPLSVLDRVMEHNRLQNVFYYQLPTGRKAGEVTKKLKESISEMLSVYPIVIGRLLRNSEGQWTIKCNDAGLRMVEAKVDKTVEEWLKNVDREKEMKLVYWEEMFHRPYIWSPFYIQITEFEGGGISIGLSCTHLLSDPISATMMIKAWADTNLGGKIISPPLFQPLPSRRPGKTNAGHKPNIILINHYKSTIQKPPPISEKNQETITLLFNQEMVKSCIDMAGTPKATPFEALVALFWTRISDIKGKKSSLVNMSICLDMRKVLGLDNGYFGNCTVYNKVKGDGLDENEISKASITIKNAIQEMDYDGIMDLIEWLERENCVNPPWMNGCDLICANLENVESYSPIFENNASLLHVSYYIEPAVGPGEVLIYPAPRDEGASGRVVMVTLPEDEVEKLLVDELIKKIGPTILMGLSKKHC